VLGQREKISKTTAMGTIAVDRLFDGVTLIPMMLIVAAIAGDKADFPVLFGRELNFAGLGIVMSVLFGIALAVLFYLALSDRGRRLLHQMVHRFAPARLKPHVESFLHSFFDGLHALRSPIDLAVAWLMSLVSWLLEATMYYMVARAFGIHEGFDVFLLLTAAANLAIAILATQGGLGAFELVVSRTLISFGATGLTGDAAKAQESLFSAYAAGLHALLLIPIVIIGFFLLWSMNLSLSEMLRGTPSEREPSESPVAEAARVTASARTVTEGPGGK
jgi:uncharacterized protein (TIRG00374 family)